MSYLGMYREQKVQLEHVEAYVDSPQAFNIFANKVEIGPESHSILSKDYSLQKMTKIMPIIAKKFGVKAIRPLKKICLKMFASGRGITIIHCQFLRLVITFRAFKEALPIINSKELPSKIDKQIATYLYRVFIILFELKKVKQALQTMQFLLKNCNKNISKVEDGLDILISAVLLKSIQKNNEFISNAIQQSLQSISHDYTMVYQQNLFKKEKIVIIRKLNTKAVISKQEKQRLLNGSGKINAKIAKIIDDKNNALIQSVQGEINNSTQRIRATEILEVPLNSRQTISNINLFKKLCKYDCKQNILYFNHDQCSKADINKMITSCFEMYNIAKKKKIEDQSARQSHSRGFGGMFGRGMGGMGMMM